LRQKVREQIKAYEQRMNEWDWNIGTIKYI
jgi:hypothetical protein